MNKFIEQSVLEDRVSAEVLNDALDTGYHAGYVGLDVHKDTIAVAVAWPGRGEAQYLGAISNTVCQSWATHSAGLVTHKPQRRRWCRWRERSCLALTMPAPCYAGSMPATLI